MWVSGLLALTLGGFARGSKRSAAVNNLGKVGKFRDTVVIIRDMMKVV
jgi:hypothetical protein